MTEPAQPSRRRTSPGEWLAAALLLLALPAIVLGIYLIGRAGPGPVPPETGFAGELNLAALLPLPAAGSPFRITSQPKQWPAERMHEKIDGEDIVYLKHGCVGLAAMTLTNPADANTLDLFLYQMAGPAAAERILAEQAPREDAPDPADRPEYVDVGDKAYLSYGCCYVRAGSFYLKIIAGSQAPGSVREVLELARRFAQRLERE